MVDDKVGDLDLFTQRVSTKNTSAVQLAEEQIISNQRDVRYIVREYPTEVLVQKYLHGRESGQNDIFVPDYQRDLVWPERNQSRFIESILIGLPIPFLFVADVSADEDPEKAGRLEIVDGVQRIRTLARFMTGELALSNLERLGRLNGFTYFDLHPSRQRRFGRATMRMIELTETVTEDVRREMFDRINSGSIGLAAVEIRRGMEQGPFLNLITELAEDAQLHALAPVSEAMKRRFEYEELVTRFFAFLDRYTEFGAGGKKVVKDFLLAYVQETNTKLSEDPSCEAQMKASWSKMLDFVQKYLPGGFTKTGRGRKVPRVRFEAISVGVGLALREKPDLIPSNVDWLESAEFKKWTTSDAANNRSNLVGRIEYVRDRLLDI